MSNSFTVTGLGLQVDKVMIMPGSELVLSAPAPSHWANFGSAGIAEKTLIVATPEAAVEAAAEADDDTADLAKQAEELGIEVDGRWGAKRLQSEIDKALAG